MSTPSLRVILIDDHSFCREGIKSLLASNSNYRVVGEAASVGEALLLVENTHPHLAIVDITLSSQSGLDFVQQVHPRGLPRCIVLSMHVSIEYINRAFNAGAYAYMSKESEIHGLLQALDKVSRGEYHLDSSLTGLLPGLHGPGMEKPAVSGSLEKLTPREHEILNLTIKGLTTKEMAKQLNVSAKTVLNHRSSLMAKLGLKNNMEFAQYALLVSTNKP